MTIPYPAIRKSRPANQRGKIFYTNYTINAKEFLQKTQKFFLGVFEKSARLANRHIFCQTRRFTAVIIALFQGKTTKYGGK